MLTDYFAAEQPIIDRLKAEVATLRQVRGMADTNDLNEKSLQTPEAFVLYSGDQVRGESEDGLDQVVLQRWTVVLAVRNVRDVKSGDALRDTAGPLLVTVNQALIGWRPAPGLGALRKASAAAAPVYRVGFAYFPQTFTAPVMLIGQGE